jgi:predicted DsbA family dithiol-disulfide isomerase
LTQWLSLNLIGLGVRCQRAFPDDDFLRKDGKYAPRIKAAAVEGQKAGVTGTPAFLLFFMESDGKMKATKTIVGAQPSVVFKDAIESLLTQKH